MLTDTDDYVLTTKEHEVSDMILKTVAGAANCKIDFAALKQEGGNSMWSVFEETAKEGEARGEVRGKAEGIIDTCYDLGLPEEDILQRLQVRGLPIWGVLVL